MILFPECESGYFDAYCLNNEYCKDNVYCADVDECTVGTHACDASATCSNVPGNYTCQCNEGFKGDGFICEDINECSTELFWNTYGIDKYNYEQIVAVPSDSLLFFMFSNDSIVDSSLLVNSSTETFSEYMIQLYRSVTPEIGYGSIYDGITKGLLDIPKNVSYNVCHDKATCINREGNYTCNCVSGYVGDGLIQFYGEGCADIDECLEGTHNCHSGARCDNTEGSFTCTCLNGYTGNGTSCFDIDECEEQTKHCDQTIDFEINGRTYRNLTATCTNTVGSFICTCPKGYADRNGNGSKCIDINECSYSTRKEYCGEHATCTNTYGGYTCACAKGYDGTPNTKDGCIDVDECAKGNICRETTYDSNYNNIRSYYHYSCENTVGSYKCHRLYGD